MYTHHGFKLTDGDCVFDVGANIGLFSLFIRQKYPNATIFAFEPGPPTFEILRINTALHKLDVKAFNYGISDQQKSASFTFFPRMSGISGFFWEVPVVWNHQKVIWSVPTYEAGSVWTEVLQEKENYACQLRPLSSVIREQGIVSIDLLKVDVELGELDVLRGIQEEDWPKVKQIVIEVHNRYLLEQIIHLLQQNGYRMVVEVENAYGKDRSVALEENPFEDGQYLVFAVRHQKQHHFALMRENVRYIPLHKPRMSDNEVRRLLHPDLYTYETAAVDIRRFLNTMQPEVSVPVHLVLLESLPRDLSGNVNRTLLSSLDAAS